MSVNVPEFNEGEALDADSLNALIAAGGKIVQVIAPLYAVRVPGGIAIGCALPEEFPARITGGTNPYSFVEVIPTASGGWTDGKRASTSTAKATELNGSASVTVGTRVLMRRSGGRWFFSLTLC